MWVQREAQLIGRSPDKAEKALRPSGEKRISQNRPDAETQQCEGQQLLPLDLSQV